MNKVAEGSCPRSCRKECGAGRLCVVNAVVNANVIIAEKFEAPVNVAFFGVNENRIVEYDGNTMKFSKKRR